MTRPKKSIVERKVLSVLQLKTLFHVSKVQTNTASVREK